MKSGCLPGNLLLKFSQLRDVIHRVRAPYLLHFTLYFIIPRTGSSTQLTENRTTIDLSFLISPDLSTNSIVKVFIKQRRY